MSNTKIFEVNAGLDDTLKKLDGITAAYGKQQDELGLIAELTKAWADHNNGVIDAINDQTKQLTEHGKLQDKLTSKEKEAAKARQKAADLLKTTLKTTYDISSKIIGLGWAGIKTTALAGLGTGLAGAAFTSLASNVGSDRYAAHELAGGESGKLKALQNVYGGTVIGSPESMLGNIREAQSMGNGGRDIVMLANLLKKTNEEIQQTNPADLAVQITTALKGVTDKMTSDWQAGGGKGQSPYIGSRQMTAYGVPEWAAGMAKTVSTFSGGELAQKQGLYASSASRFQIQDETQKKYQDTIMAAEAAKIQIENDFLKVLQNVNPEMQKLSDVISNIIQGGVESGAFRDAVHAGTEKLKEFIAYLGSDDAKKDWDDICKKVSNTADALESFGNGLHRWGVNLGFVEESQSELDARMAGVGVDAQGNRNADFDRNHESMGERLGNDLKLGISTAWDKGKELLVGGDKKEEQGVGWVMNKAGIDTGGDFVMSEGQKVPKDLHKQLAKKFKNSPDIEKAFDRASERSGLPKDFIMSMSYAESSYNNQALSNKGAGGIMQVMPATAKQWGLDPADRNDPIASIDAMGKYLEHLNNIFHDPMLVAGAYNSGENRESLRQGRLPNIKQTKDYWARIHAIGAVQGGTRPPEMKPTKQDVTVNSKITIDNGTGNNINAQAVTAAGG